MKGFIITPDRTERGIKGAHGFLAERYAENPRYLVAVPERLGAVGVLLEPLTVVEKAVEQIWRIQSRLVWSPRRALVLGAGTIGTLATLLLRLTGLEVHLYSRGDGGRGRRVAEAAGATFMSADERRLDHSVEKEIGPIDVVIEATGYTARWPSRRWTWWAPTGSSAWPASAPVVAPLRR